MEFFQHTLEVRFSSEKPPVKFVHKRSVDAPSSHVLHLNDYVEIYVYVSGDTDYVVEDRYFSLSRGDTLVISPHEVHVPILKRECTYERFYLLFPLDVFSGLSFDPLSGFIQRQERSPRQELSDAEREELLAILYDLGALSASAEEEGAALRAAGLILQLLGLLLRAEDRPTARTSESPAGVPLLLREILQYVSLASQEIATVGDVAAHFHISAPYLSSLFRKYVGVTASEYLRIQKIARAKMLLETGCSVADACYECGFSDSSHFIKNFRRYVGMTPKQYRSLYVKEAEKR